MIKCDCNALDAKIFKCRDCGSCTQCNYEYYMVTDRVWYSAVTAMDASGMLCIGCLESRIDRFLKSEDFTPAPINQIAKVIGTTRIKTRLMTRAKVS